MGALLRLVALVASLLVAMGFVAFAADELERGSRSQQHKLDDSLAEAAPAPSDERQRERRNGDVREVIDDANDVLLTPFSGLIESDNPWVNRGVPTLLALLAFGLGLTLLANLRPKSAASGGDWRTPDATRPG